MKILTLNAIADCGLNQFGPNDVVGDQTQNPEGILVRSAAMADYEFGSDLLAIARAGAGVNNIPIDRCSEAGIVVFNTPGANANAVKELVLTGLLLSSRKITQGVDWARGLKGHGDTVGKEVEKGKKAFVGPELTGKKLGVIGLGAIGVLVANAAEALGMEVYGYDPYLSVNAAWKLSSTVHHADKPEEIYAACDYITVHVPLMDNTKNMICTETIAMMKDGVRILNFARGGLVNDADILAALESGKVACYVTDFPNDTLLDVENVIAIPHLGASTPESEDNCAEMAAAQMIDYLQNGNIVNSVNFPALSAPKAAQNRLCVLHQNIPAVLTQISGELSAAGMNIEQMSSKSKKELAYAIFDVDHPLTQELQDRISKVEGVLRIRAL